MGLEYITQPQVFTAPITALQGVAGINEAYPLLTTYQYWTSTAVVPTSTFPIPGLWTMLSEPGSFIVAIGGIIQPPTEYTIDRNNRLVNFNSLISADLEVSFTQLATHAPSSQSFDYVQSVSAEFINLSGNNVIIQNLSSINVITNNLTATNLLVTNLTALSSVLNIVDITQYELSGFNVQGNANIIGNTTVTGLVSANNIIANNNVTTNSLSALNYLINDNGSFIGATSATTINIGSLSARTLDLIHAPANDGVDPIFNIGETGTEGFSGIRIRYEEPSNRLILSSRTGSTTLTSAIINTVTGEVGISGLPVAGQALTVSGNISASGKVFTSVRPVENFQTFINSFDHVATTQGTLMYPPSGAIVIAPGIVYNAIVNGVLTQGTASTMSLILCGNQNFTVTRGYAHFFNDGATLTFGIPITSATGSIIRTIPTAGNLGITTFNYLNASYLLSSDSTTTINMSAINISGVGATLQARAGSNWRLLAIG